MNYNFTDLLEQLPPLPGQDPLNFSKPIEKQSVQKTLLTEIHEGGGPENNRWSSFGQVAGHYIHQARLGSITQDEAYNYTCGWALENMKPVWPRARIDKANNFNDLALYP